LPSTLISVEAACVGAGAASALGAGTRGSVVAVFSRATYVRTAGGLMAFTPPGTYPGPLHVLLAGPIPPLAAGTSVCIEPTRVVIGGVLELGLAAAERWTGHHPEPAALHAAKRLAGHAVAPIAAHAALLSQPWSGATDGWAMAVADGDIEWVARCLAGLGPGLTPSGDDVLAGVLLIARLLWGAAAEGRLLRCARRADTSELSAAFLLWAARGQSLAPVHGLLQAATEGRRTDAFRFAGLLAHVGASSGADLCLGMQRALDCLPVR